MQQNIAHWILHVSTILLQKPKNQAENLLQALIQRQVQKLVGQNPE